MSTAHDAKEKLLLIKNLMSDIERHLDAGAIVKANSRAADLNDVAKKLFNVTYELAFPGKCTHQGGKTEVQGGGETCNKCGDFC
jgi:hypothetical protein